MEEFKSPVESIELPLEATFERVKFNLAVDQMSEAQVKELIKDMFYHYLVMKAVNARMLKEKLGF